jgi:hypothetical protein
MFPIRGGELVRGRLTHRLTQHIVHGEMYAPPPVGKSTLTTPPRQNQVHYHHV